MKENSISEGLGRNLRDYLEIIYRWLERQGFGHEEIDVILNNPDIINLIEQGEYHGKNPILLIKNSPYKYVIDNHNRYEKGNLHPLKDKHVKEKI